MLSVWAMNCAFGADWLVTWEAEIWEFIFGMLSTHSLSVFSLNFVRRNIDGRNWWNRLIRHGWGISRGWYFFIFIGWDLLWKIVVGLSAYFGNASIILILFLIFSAVPGLLDRLQSAVNSLKLNNTGWIELGFLPALGTDIHLKSKVSNTNDFLGQFSTKWIAAQLIQGSCRQVSISICSWCLLHSTHGRIYY